MANSVIILVSLVLLLRIDCDHAMNTTIFTNKDVADFAFAVRLEMSTDQLLRMKSVLQHVLRRLNLGTNTTKLALIAYGGSGVTQLVDLEEGVTDKIDLVADDVAKLQASDAISADTLKGYQGTIRSLAFTDRKNGRPQIAIIFLARKTGLPANEESKFAEAVLSNGGDGFIISNVPNGLLSASAYTKVGKDVRLSSNRTGRLGWLAARTLRTILASCPHNKTESYCYYKDRATCLINVTYTRSSPKAPDAYCIDPTSSVGHCPTKLCEKVCDEFAEWSKCDAPSCEIDGEKIRRPNPANPITAACPVKKDKCKDPRCRLTRLPANSAGKIGGKKAITAVVAILAIVVIACILIGVWIVTRPKIELPAGMIGMTSMISMVNPPSLTSTPVDVLMSHYAHQEYTKLSVSKSKSKSKTAKSVRSKKVKK